ncbi:hypothetical protein [Armatimonas sp.]|uniref:hypothetical protein n=1 Tax=Armatimonas sp. TaxID=1872638 RepID=UPI00374D9B46
MGRLLNDPHQKDNAQSLATRLVTLAQDNDRAQLATWIGVAQTYDIKVNVYCSPGEIEGFLLQEDSTYIHVNTSYPEIKQCGVMVYLLGRYIQLIEHTASSNTIALLPGDKIEYNRPDIISPKREREESQYARTRSQKPKSEIKEAKFIARQVVQFVIDPGTPAVDSDIAALKQVTSEFSPEEREQMADLVMKELFKDAGRSKNRARRRRH